MDFDVVIVGGGPAGLAAALTLGRARKRVLLCDAGPPRNVAAVRVQNFVTRDGIPPSEFRAVARQQLGAYPNVRTQDVRVNAISGERGRFHVRLEHDTVGARRALLCTGMIDELPAIEGLAPLWGKSIFACPYCHAWEVQDQRFAYLAFDLDRLMFPLFLRGWTRHATLLTNGELEVPADVRERLIRAGVQIDERPIARLSGRAEHLHAIEFRHGEPLFSDVLFMHPRQWQVGLVTALGLALDAKGFVQVDDSRETSVAGVYAAGDLITPVQGALLAAASGTQAAAMLNHALTLELADAGAIA
jgi:thioredoxin reductase